MKALWQMAILFPCAVAVAIGVQFARYFSASGFCLLFVASISITAFFFVKRRVSVTEVLIRGTPANPATLGLLAAALAAAVSYNLAALINMGIGRPSIQDATVVTVTDGRRCSTLVNAELKSGKSVTYCAGYSIMPGIRVRLNLVSSLLGIYATRS
jgi:hypothetical protein